MAQLRLVLADEEEDYVESMVEFLILHYSTRFQISSFTKADSLFKYLSDAECKADILLVSPSMYAAVPEKEKLPLLMLLSSGRIPLEMKQYNTISKYQQGEKFVRHILENYCANHPGEVIETGGGKKAAVISCYSPSGGSGKTSIAVGSCIQLAQRGYTVFYLNLEDIPSTPAFFLCGGEKNLSHLLYYIREKSTNFMMRIETVRNIDPQSGVHYFSPPESFVEMQEWQPDETAFLIAQLKSTGIYDFIIVDLSSSFRDTTLRALEQSDRVVLVCAHGPVPCMKADNYIGQGEILMRKMNSPLEERTLLLINKYNPGSPIKAKEMPLRCKADHLTIPWDTALNSAFAISYTADLNTRFGRGVQALVDRLVQIKQDWSSL